MKIITRIFLLLAILAAGGAAFLSHTKVQEKINTIIGEKEKAEGERNKEVAEKKKVQAQLAETETKLDATTKELAQTQGELKTAQDSIEKEKALTAQVRGELAKSKKETETVRKENKEYDDLKRDLKLNVAGIRKAVADLKTTREQLEVTSKENEILARNNKKLAAELKIKEDPYVKIPLPPGLKGKIIAVDPKWNFVVLDIGENQGVLRNGEMIVTRNQNLIGKVRIESVSADRCIANLLPGWKKDEVLEGDAVVY